MNVLDKLRKLDDAASPGPWEVDRANIGIKNGDLHLLDKDGSVLARFYVPTFTNAELAALAHLLRTAYEALERTADLLDGIAEGEAELHAVRHARAVFAKLEEAL